jgi:hypothetical protein
MDAQQVGVGLLRISELQAMSSQVRPEAALEIAFHRCDGGRLLHDSRQTDK